MERRLVRSALANPNVLATDDLRRLRYLISFARLTVFEPGAAGGGQRGRGDVDVTDELAPWRLKVIDAFGRSLRDEADPVARLRLARGVLRGLEAEQTEQRLALIDRHRNDFSPAELDAEVGLRSLVLVLGGGGGAGFVYVGALKQLVETGRIPDYMMGGSMGAILGGIFARELPVPIEQYIEFAHSLSYRGILGPEPRTRRHGLTSLFALRYDAFAADLFRRPDGEQMRMEDLAIPFDCVVSGVHQDLFSRLPARFRRQELANVQGRALPLRPISIGPVTSSRLWQIASFIDSRVVKPLVIGADELTRQFDVVDAQSFSAAIPGILHHEVKSERMTGLVDQWMEQKKVAALIDGVAAANVPVELAWRRLREGRIGTRNGVVIALDSMHPRWDPKHLWMTPVTQAVAVQMIGNAPYADHLERMDPTLSPVTLAPNRAGMDRAIGWGEDSMRALQPLLDAFTQPVWWDGDRPSYDEHPEKPRRTSLAPSMSSVLEAYGRQREWWQRTRGRYFT
ncbi:patatin-like phospholipase family protein [Nocardioides cavernaquae]|uniref:Patatin-like phospholipase family protein n=2 Tax=Nocardioides cavernaquae TaxID=2321396 RepID=A0A3A5HC49_9ACTN|nr:patatin-like phospholipase family protein [Nocardioides cavernaquae]